MLTVNIKKRQKKLLNVVDINRWCAAYYRPKNSEFYSEGKKAIIKLLITFTKLLIKTKSINALILDPELREFHQITKEIDVIEQDSFICEQNNYRYRLICKCLRLVQRAPKINILKTTIESFIATMPNFNFDYIHLDLMGCLQEKHAQLIYNALNKSTTGVIFITLADSWLTSKKGKLYKNRRLNVKHPNTKYIENINGEIPFKDIKVLKHIPYSGIKGKTAMRTYIVCYKKDKERFKDIIKR